MDAARLALVLQLSQELGQIGSWELDLRDSSVRVVGQLRDICLVRPGAAEGDLSICLDRVHPDDRDRQAQRLERARAGEGSRGAYRMVLADGRIRHIRDAIVVVRDEAETPIRVVTVLHDETEAVIHRLRQAELERELAESQRIESLGRLVGGIAHDFRNLLSVIVGNVSLAQEATAEDEREHCLEEIARAAGLADELCQNMLDYGGVGQLQVVDIDLGQLVEDAVALVRARPSSTSALDVVVEPDLPAVRADRAQLQQIVINLVLNALEAASDGGHVRLRVGLAQAPRVPVRPDEVAVRFVVEDDGEGMDPVVQARVFEPFFTTRRHGRGLGLAAVQGIVRRHRGEIVFSSDAGRGATFVVDLPLRRAAPEWRSLPPDALPVPTVRGRVLVVDDEPGMRALLDRAIRATGAECTLARDGLEGLDRLREAAGRFDLVFLDLTMPRLDGVGTLEAIRTAWPTLPVAIMTSHLGSALGERLDELMPSARLVRPFRMDGVWDLIREHVPPAEPLDRH